MKIISLGSGGSLLVGQVARGVVATAAAAALAQADSAGGGRCGGRCSRRWWSASADSAPRRRMSREHTEQKDFYIYLTYRETHNHCIKSYELIEQRDR